jgi:hypothetical protein
MMLVASAGCSVALVLVLEIAVLVATGVPHLWLSAAAAAHVVETALVHPAREAVLAEGGREPWSTPSTARCYPTLHGRHELAVELAGLKGCLPLRLGALSHEFLQQCTRLGREGLVGVAAHVGLHLRLPSVEAVPLLGDAW